MEESQITVDGVTYPMAEPFFVMATQNPVESYGTFPLPEAQLDRFFMRLSLGYMTREQEMEVVSRPSTADILNSLEPVVSPEVIQEMKELYTKVRVQKDVLGYMMDIVERPGRRAGLLPECPPGGPSPSIKPPRPWLRPWDGIL